MSLYKGNKAYYFDHANNDFSLNENLPSGKMAAKMKLDEQFTII